MVPELHRVSLAGRRPGMAVCIAKRKQAIHPPQEITERVSASHRRHRYCQACSRGRMRTSAAASAQPRAPAPPRHLANPSPTGANVRRNAQSSACNHDHPLKIRSWNPKITSNDRLGCVLTAGLAGLRRGGSASQPPAERTPQSLSPLSHHLHSPSFPAPGVLMAGGGSRGRDLLGH